MDDNERANHRLKHLYENALLVGECAEAPNYLLVCFAMEDQDKMERALDEFEAQNGYRPEQTKVDALGAFTGFWMKKALTQTTDPVLAKLEHHPKVEEAHYLEARANEGGIPLLQAATVDELNMRLLPALKRGIIATFHPRLN